MQDYDGPPGYHPLIGEGAWPDRWVNLIGLLLLILAVAAVMMAYRAGQRARLEGFEYRRRNSIRIIFDSVRYELDQALLATGERSFGPAQTVLDTLDHYLGPLLLVGKELGSPTRDLRDALAGKPKKRHDPGHASGHGGGAAHGHHDGHGDHGSTVVIATDPSTVSASAAGGGAASASVSGPLGGVAVLQPARVFEIGGAGGHAGRDEMTARERVQSVREALEDLSEYWERGRVEGQLLAVQEALSDARPRSGRAAYSYGGEGRRSRRRRGGFEDAVAASERDANSGFPWFRF